MFFQAQVGGNVGDHLRDVRRHLRRLGNEGGIHVADAPAGFAHQMQGLAQQDAAVDVLVLRLGVGEMAPDVAQRRRPQQRIANGMQQHIRIGMTEQAFLIRNVHPAEDKLAPHHQLMNVETLSDTHNDLL